MISNFVKYELSDSEKGEVKAAKARKTLTLKYPCSSTATCTPYKLTLSPGAYQFECWGSKGSYVQNPSYPGKGAYTKGTIAFFKKTEVYVYVGATGFFNSYKNETKMPSGAFGTGGGSTDVRLKFSAEWYENESLASRIMVAAGGGGVEWKHAIGGNGGELTGETSTSYNLNSVVIAEVNVLVLMQEHSDRQEHFLRKKMTGEGLVAADIMAALHMILLMQEAEDLLSFPVMKDARQ